MLKRSFKEDFSVVVHSVAIPKKIDELQMQKECQLEWQDPVAGKI